MSNDDAFVRWSSSDKAPQLQLQDDGRTIVGEKGYRLGRADCSVARGDCFFELTIGEAKTNKAHTRVGWARGKAELQAPLGYDEFGYSFRSKEGSKCHRSLLSDYGSAYSSGDVIGCRIVLPDVDAEVVRRREVLNLGVDADQVLPGSSIEFYLNGVSQGVAFTDIIEGDYYPAASLYMGAVVTLNPGPVFRYPPGETASCQPLSMYRRDQILSSTN